MLHSVENGGEVPHLTVEDVARRWKCQPQTVRQRRQQWGLKPFRFGKRLLFTVASVEAVERRRAENTK